MRKLILLIVLCAVFPPSAMAGNTYMTVTDARRALTGHLPTIREEMGVKRALVDNCARVDNSNVTCDVLVKWSADESPYGAATTVATQYFMTGGNCRSVAVENQADDTPTVRRNVCPKKKPPRR